jgi:hypothetical protein
LEHNQYKKRITNLVEVNIWIEEIKKAASKSDAASL